MGLDKDEESESRGQREIEWRGTSRSEKCKSEGLLDRWTKTQSPDQDTDGLI